MGTLTRVGIVIGLFAIAWGGFGLSADASASGLYVDDDGIPEERNIEHLSSRGILDPCGAPEGRTFCPGQVVGIEDTILAIMRSSLAADGSALARLSEEWVIRLASRLSGSGLVVEAVSRDVLVEAVVSAFELTAPTSFESSWADGAGPQFAVAAYHALFDPTAPMLGVDRAVTRADLAKVLARALGEDACGDDPFTGARVRTLEDRYPAQTFQAYAYDTRNGCAYWMNPDERMRTASVFKVMVMAGTLLEAQQDQRELSDGEMEALIPMITESANWPVRSLWRLFGASPWFSEQGETFGLDQTNVVGDSGRSWGGTRTSAKDQVDLLRQVLLGEWGPLDPESREVAWELMTSVVDSQTWGITGGVPKGWTVAQKNGFAGRTANSVGYVQEPDGDGGYFLAILTYGWPEWRSGVSPIEEVAGWVAEVLAIETD